MNSLESNETISFHIEGMTCPSCAHKIESILTVSPGVTEAGVNFARKEASVVFDPAEISLEDLKRAVEEVGYRIQKDQKEETEKINRLAALFKGTLPYLTGVSSAIGVVGFYLGLLTLTSDWYNARLEFEEYGLWILALALGLGIQATLYSLFRGWHQGGESMKAAKCTMAASGGMSTTAMAACCAHYLGILLPALGLPFLSAAAASLAQYQTYFFMAGVISNLIGIGFMLRMMHRSGMIRLRFPAINLPLPAQRANK